MGDKQFNNTVSGTGGTLATNTTGTVETDNYANGGDYAAGGDSGTSFPLAVNPAATMQEITFTAAGNHVVDIHTTGGDVISLRMASSLGVWDKWEVDKLVLRDPDGTGELICGGWAGE